jgi:hypothetical protein
MIREETGYIAGSISIVYKYKDRKIKTVTGLKTMML